jgi:cytochrome oxidase Cu insertion factor (SCO1/SenC/PrrC family)
MRPRRARVQIPLALLLSGGAVWQQAVRAAGDPAPAAGRPRVDASRLPAPGSYTLARIQRCPDGEVLSSDGRSHRLHALLQGRNSVLSFMYTYCRDPVGCPLAYQAMVRTHEALAADAALASRSQLVSLSFDPTNDTPRQMAIYGHGRADDPRVRWRFLTTASVARLLPLLDGLGQDVSVESDAKGRPTRTLNHMLKLFLIDARLWVREVYSVATLDPAALLNDLRTLAMEGPIA